METLRILANCHWPVFLRGKFTKISRGIFSLLFKRLLEGCYLLLYVTCPQIIPCKVWHTENSNNLGMLSLEFKVFYSCSHPDSYYGIGVSLRKLSRAVRCYLGLFISMWVVWLTSSASTDSPLCIIYIHSCINHSTIYSQEKWVHMVVYYVKNLVSLRYEWIAGVILTVWCLMEFL